MHWKASTPTVSFLPMADDEELSGRNGWLDICNAAMTFKSSCGNLNDLKMPVLLHEWVEVQKQLVMLKYRNHEAVVNISGFNIMLPHAREQKLREIGICK